jgi:hypothetical protein
MRDLFKNAMTGTLVAGAALMVSACGGGESADANNTAGANFADETLMATDNSALDAMNGTGNLGAEGGLNTTGTTGTDMNSSGTTGTTGTTGGNMTDTGTTGTGNTTGTGTGTGNTTGM